MPQPCFGPARAPPKPQLRCIEGELIVPAPARRALPQRPAVNDRSLPHRPERPAHRAPRSLPAHATVSPIVTTDPARQPLRGPCQTRPRSA